MIDEIDKILGKLIRKEISECNSIDELFDLFNVSNRALQKKSIRSKYQILISWRHF